jgi:hypothetical protein
LKREAMAGGGVRVVVVVVVRPGRVARDLLHQRR